MAVTKEDISHFQKTIISVHDRIISVSGGLPGIRDQGGLEHALYTALSTIEKRPEDTFRNAAESYHLFATRHYFNDGNKRTAHMFVKLYLLTFNIHLKLNYENAVPFIIAIADNKKSISEIEAWLKQNSIKIRSLTIYIGKLNDEIKDIKKFMDKS